MTSCRCKYCYCK